MTNDFPGNAAALVARNLSIRWCVASMQLPSSTLTRYPGSHGVQAPLHGAALIRPSAGLFPVPVSVRSLCLSR